MLNPNLAAKISYERILNNFQNKAVNRSGVLGKQSENENESRSSEKEAGSGPLSCEHLSG